MRRAARVDATQQSIVKALRDAGAYVYVIGLPCDLLTRYRGRWLPIEVKSGKHRDPRQKAQAAFLKAQEVPVVTTAIEALIAIGAMQPGRVIDFDVKAERER